MIDPEEIESLPAIENWDQMCVDPGRTETFQAFLESLETRAVRRARVKPEKTFNICELAMKIRLVKTVIEIER